MAPIRTPASDAEEDPLARSAAGPSGTMATAARTGDSIIGDVLDSRTPTEAGSIACAAGVKAGCSGVKAGVAPCTVPCVVGVAVGRTAG